MNASTHTLRDEFAAAALTGWLANSARLHNMQSSEVPQDKAVEAAARYSWIIADAMLQTREQAHAQGEAAAASKCQRVGGCLHDLGYEKCCCDDGTCDFQESTVSATGCDLQVFKSIMVYAAGLTPVGRDFTRSEQDGVDALRQVILAESKRLTALPPEAGL